MDLHNEICSLVDVVKEGAEDRRFAASYFSCKYLVIVDVKGLDERDCLCSGGSQTPFDEADRLGGAGRDVGATWPGWSSFRPSTASGPLYHP